MKIVFIISSVTDSHILRRIESFLNAGFEVDVYGFARGVNTVNRLKGIPLHIIGHVEDQKYFGRIRSEWNAVNDVLKRYSRDVLFYVWGFELAAICMLKGRKYLYEISDMRYPQLSTPMRQIFGWLDKRMIKKSLGTLMTSEGFIQYIGMDLNDCSFLLMPNKLTESFKNMNRPHPINLTQKVRFGFVGYYRYPDTVIRMARVIGESYPNYEFHFWGTGPEHILSQVKGLALRFDNVIEHGSFKNPDDLYKVYDSVDVIACNYDARGVNERIAEPNKLYESIFFNKPIIVSQNTFLGQKVERMGVGFVIESHTDESIKLFLDNLNIEDINIKSKKENSILTEELLEDYTEVWERIYKIKN